MAMHMTFRQLKVFEAVARHLSFTRAAEELHLTQPAVSMQVKQLEQNVGLSLFEQLGKKIYLTEAGDELRRYARNIEAELAEAEQVLDELKGVSGGKLKITVATTVNYFAPKLLAGYCREFPDVKVSLDVTNRKVLLRQLEDNETDIVLMGRPPPGLDVDADPFMENPLVVIAAPDHALARRRKLKLQDLSEETFITREQGSGTRSTVERFLAERNATPAYEIEMNSNEAIKQSVEAGLGIGVVSEHTVELELETGRLIILPVEGFPIMRRWYVVNRQGKRLSAAAQAFRDYVLREVVKIHPRAASAQK